MWSSLNIYLQLLNISITFFLNACRLHIPFLGFKHDLTKFHPTEFFRSVKYFAGDKSPTIVEREYNDGISKITLHHTLRNKHHWHAHVDFLPSGIIIAPIDFRHSLEYVADILSASKVYMKKNYTIHKAYEYFYNECFHYLMHPPFTHRETEVHTMKGAQRKAWKYYVFYKNQPRCYWFFTKQIPRA